MDLLHYCILKSKLPQLTFYMPYIFEKLLYHKSPYIIWVFYMERHSWIVHISRSQADFWQTTTVLLCIEEYCVIIWTFVGCFKQLYSVVVVIFNEKKIKLAMAWCFSYGLGGRSPSVLLNGEWREVKPPIVTLRYQVLKKS